MCETLRNDTKEEHTHIAMGDYLADRVDVEYELNVEEEEEADAWATPLADVD